MAAEIAAGRGDERGDELGRGPSQPRRRTGRQVPGVIAEDGEMLPDNVKPRSRVAERVRSRAEFEQLKAVPRQARRSCRPARCHRCPGSASRPPLRSGRRGAGPRKSCGEMPYAARNRWLKSAVSLNPHA